VRMGALECLGRDHCAIAKILFSERDNRTLEP
jgi:hypothetical protein